jgi:hypothetical protein
MISHIGKESNISSCKPIISKGDEQMLQILALYLSLIMAILLFLYAFYEGIKIADSEGKVHGGTFILSVISAFIFSAFTFVFY